MFRFIKEFVFCARKSAKIFYTDCHGTKEQHVTFFGQISLTKK